VIRIRHDSMKEVNDTNGRPYRLRKGKGRQLTEEVPPSLVISCGLGMEKEGRQIRLTAQDRR
jgi:hypothetical protein